MRVKFENSTKDVQLSEVTKENYIVPKGEETLYHVIQEVKSFDQKTGKRLSKPVLQKYDAKVWVQQRKALVGWGYDLTVVHDPSEYNKKLADEREKNAEEKRRMAVEAEQKRREDERNALKEELRKELMDELKKEAGKKEAKKTNK